MHNFLKLPAAPSFGQDWSLRGGLVSDQNEQHGLFGVSYNAF